MNKGDLVRWIHNTGEDKDEPCLVVKGPYEGFFQNKPWSEVTMVVDLFLHGKIIKKIPLSNIEKWVIESCHGE